MPRYASRVALAAAATVALTLPLTGTASAMSYDRHEVPRTAVMVQATPGHLVAARGDVLRAGGRVVRWLPALNGFVAQVPVTAVAGLRTAYDIARVSVQGALIRQ